MRENGFKCMARLKLWLMEKIMIKERKRAVLSMYMPRLSFPPALNNVEEEKEREVLSKCLGM